MEPAEEQGRGEVAPDHEPVGRDGAQLAADAVDAAEGLEDALGEAEVADAAAELSVLDEEGAVTGHAGHDGASGVEKTVHVVEAGDEEAAGDLADEVLDAGVAGEEDQVCGHGLVAELDAERGRVAGRWLPEAR